MAKACNRCEKSIRQFNMQFKMTGVVKRYIDNIDRIMMRKREGHSTPEYDIMKISGKIDLCEDCQESFAKWLSESKEEIE